MVRRRRGNYSPASSFAETGGEPWLVGKDVAQALGYTNPRDALRKHVDSEDRNTVAFCDGIKGNPNMTIINESGLYSLILSSKLPGAKKIFSKTS